MSLNARNSGQPELENPLVSYREESDTLLVDNVEIRLDTALGDEELGVSLLIESLEQQYRDMILEGEPVDNLVSLQSAKEWLSEQPGKIAGLFHYLKSLSTDQ